MYMSLGKYRKVMQSYCYTVSLQLLHIWMEVVSINVQFLTFLQLTSLKTSFLTFVHHLLVAVVLC